MQRTHDPPSHSHSRSPTDARSSRRDVSAAFALRAFRGCAPFGCTSFGARARFRGRTCCAGRAQIFLQLFEVAQDGLVHLLEVATCIPQEPRYVFAKVLSACPDAAADRTQLLLGGLECCFDSSDRTSVLLEACTRGCGRSWASSRFLGGRFTRGCCFGSGGFPSFGFTYWRHRCSFVLELQHALPPRFSQFSAARPRESRPRSHRVRDSAGSARRPYWTVCRCDHRGVRSTTRLFRKGSRNRQRERSWWVSRSEGRCGLGGGGGGWTRPGVRGAPSGPCGRDLVVVELQQVVGCGDQPPFGSCGGSSSALEAIHATVELRVSL